MTMVLMLFAFPTAWLLELSLLTTDRVLGTVFFSSTQEAVYCGMELFWFFGHPEVYIVVFPALGIIAEVFVTFAHRPLFAKKIFIAEFTVTFLSLGVWMHHMFTTGVNYEYTPEVLKITTLAISIPFEGAELLGPGSPYKSRIKIDRPQRLLLSGRGSHL